MKQWIAALKYSGLSLGACLLIGFFVPEKMVIPVQGASSHDWHHQTFWHEPWGTSGVHKGIDIFGAKTTPVVAATAGVVIFSGVLTKGGNAVAILGPKWRIHYFAHLERKDVVLGDIVDANDQIGTLGDSGNAAGKAPHVHYSILSIIPLPWRATLETQGWKKMFFIDPHQTLTNISY